MLRPENFCDFNLNNTLEFVGFWERYYMNDAPKIVGTNEKIDYISELNINKNLTIQNIIRLLRWKDSRMLTYTSGTGKTNSRVQGVIEKIKDLNNFRNGQSSEEHFKRITANIFQHGHVWRIFLFHICKPSEYPIIDRYVKLAFCCHTGHNFQDDWTLENAWDRYQQYIQYFKNIYTSALGNHVLDNDIEHVQVLKRVDNALMAFGQFLSKYGNEPDPQ